MVSSRHEREGSAFPQIIKSGDGSTTIFYGLTFRDYFAAHAPEPSIEDLAVAAGLTVRQNFVFNGQDFLGELSDWRRTTPGSVYLALVAKYRWAYADAMLKAREGGE